MNGISKQILQSDRFFLKTLIGALLIYSGIGIPFYIGYVARYLRQLSEHRSVELPAWNHWLALLIESWELLLAILAYAVIPCGVIYWITAFVDQWFGFLWVVVWLPFMLSLLAAPIFVSLAYHHYLQRGIWDSIFELPLLYKRFLATIDNTLPTTVMFWGALLIGFPVFGFTIAVTGIIYLSVNISAIDANRYR